MPESFEVSAVLPASPQQLYLAWLSSDEHTAFTGGGAEVDPRVGGRFTAWDGYIEGKTLELEPHRRIVQTWRTAEFPEGSEDSRLEVRLEEADGGTKITLVHTNIPDGQGEDYRHGWLGNYFDPMQEYFSGQA